MRAQTGFIETRLCCDSGAPGGGGGGGGGVQGGWVEGEDRVCVELGWGDRPHCGEVTAGPASQAVPTWTWYKGVC